MIKNKRLKLKPGILPKKKPKKAGWGPLPEGAVPEKGAVIVSTRYDPEATGVNAEVKQEPEVKEEKESSSEED